MALPSNPYIAGNPVGGSPAYEDWLRQQEFHGLLTREANDWLKTATQDLRTALQDGAKSLMEATVQGWVQGMTGCGI
jgi:hypothetical protein